MRAIRALLVVGPLTLSGCSQGADFSAHFQGRGTFASAALIEATVEYRGRRLARFSGDDFSASGTTRTIHVPGSGTLLVRVAVLGAAPDTLAASEVEIPLSDGWHYGVGITAGMPRPMGVCVPPSSVIATPIVGHPADTLFMSSGGLPDGAIC